MGQNRFMAFIQGRQWSDNLRDFVEHAKGDPDLPDAESWEQLEAYLRQIPTTVDQTIEAARYVWQLYDADD